ncbi:MAG: hypothetical protein IVW54_22910 [Candidatus Binataceae bacterium]|nr:hypothetical protein [Candidatus Binataceae bacterium]
MSGHDIVSHIRQAVAHERAAAGHEDKYENQMKAAGASMYAAFVAAVRSSDEHKGRKIDDKAILRLYKSTAPRPWWDAALLAARVTTTAGKADREHSKRLIQWHVDLDGARQRRAQHALRVVSGRKSLSKQGTTATQGARVRPEPTTAEVRTLTATPDSAGEVRLEDLLGEVSRLQLAAKRVEPAHRAEALEVLKVSARQIERYVP